MPEVSAAVQKVMDEAGVQGVEMDRMLRHAALVSHERGNRRYHEWVFRVQRGVVVEMSHLEPPHVLRDARIGVDRVGARIAEDCPECEGDGCKDCGWTGEVLVILQ